MSEFHSSLIGQGRRSGVRIPQEPGEWATGRSDLVKVEVFRVFRARSWPCADIPLVINLLLDRMGFLKDVPVISVPELVVLLGPQVLEEHPVVAELARGQVSLESDIGDVHFFSFWRYNGVDLDDQIAFFTIVEQLLPPRVV